MSNETKLFRLSGSALVIDLRTGHNATLRPGLVVLSEDAHTHAMGALEAECERFRELAKANGRALGDALRDYDALAAELAAIRAAGGEVVEVCDGKEQEAFEEFAKGQKMDMAVHPMHWLFLNKETYAARQGWKAAIRYCVTQHQRIVAAMAAELEQLRNDAGAEMFLTLSGELAQVRAELEAARKQEPVAWRYRHSEQEHWHVGDSPKSWWECQPLYALPPLAGKVSVPEWQALVPMKFVQGFNTLAHNYSLRAVPPDYYDGMAGDAFRDAYARCGRDLAELRALLATPSMEVKHDA